MNISFGHNSSEKNKIGKNISTTVPLSGYLRNETNVVNPTIRVEASIETLAGCNYMEIPAFNRKYFITDIRSINNKICEVSGHCDVLETYGTEIKTNKAIVGRTATQGNWNLFLNDPMQKVTNKTSVSVLPFPKSFPKDQFSLMLIVLG